MNTEALTRYQMVEILFLDSVAIASGWTTPDDYLRHASDAQQYRATGYWIGEQDDQVVIAGALDAANDTINNVFAIPLGAVLDIRTVPLGLVMRSVNEPLADGSAAEGQG